jgi:phosphate transport system protein
MERHFDEELTSLKKDITAMGALVELAISRSVGALKSLNCSVAQQVIASDRVLDEMEVRIDQRCIDLLALHQPMAIDLRFIAMAIEITTDLERMGDLAVDIAQRVVELCDKPLLKPLVDIPLLAEIAQRMTRQSIDSFVNQDGLLARQVILEDARADGLRNTIQTELLNDYMLKDSSTITRAMPLLLAARHLERICDHATNIAEDIIYMVEAKSVKHRHEVL